MKKFATIAGLLLVASFAAAQSATVLTGPFEEALAQAQKQNKLILIDFYSSGWGSCKLLVQQFYDNPKYADFLNANVVLYRAVRGTKSGDAVFEKFDIRGTPTELFLDKNGREIDWILGYGPPADKFLEKVKKALAGIDTYQSLSDRYVKEPDNIEVVFKLAEKVGDRGTPALETRSKELYQKVLAMDLQGRTGSYYNEYLKASIPYVEAAEFALAQTTVFSRKPDPTPLRAFIKKYPDSKLLKNAYSYLSYYYGQMAPKEEAGPFFEEYAAKYPDDKNVLTSYIERIVRDKEPLERGIELALKLQEMTGYPKDPGVQQNLAQLYALKEEPGKADEEYGKDFIDDHLSSSIFALTGYADFWIEQGRNLESAEEAADVAAAGIGARKDVPSYYLSQVAGIYAKLNKNDKALAVYGPAVAKKGWDDQNALASYAAFWSRQGQNLESAAEAGRRSVDLASDYYNNFILGQVLFKLKKYPEALKAAEKAVELAKPMAAKYEGFTTAQYDNLVKQIKEAMAKAPEVKK
jgi:thioredoxin-related protein